MLALDLAGIQREGRTYVVPSRTRGGLEHRVTPTLDGCYVCTCEAAAFGSECWAVKLIREETRGMSEQTMALAPVQVLPPQALLPSERDYALIDKAAQMAFSGAVALPRELNTPQKVGAVMLYGWELGLRPMTALQELYIVNGRVQPSARIMAGLLHARTDASIKIVEATDKKCTLRLIWPSRRIDETYTVEWAEIERAKLANGNVWQAYPRDKLITHCTKRLLRVYAPDIINGITGPILTDVAPAEEEPDESELWNPGEQVIDHETGEIIETSQLYEPVQAPPAPPKPQPQPDPVAPIDILNEIAKRHGPATAAQAKGIMPYLYGTGDLLKLKGDDRADFRERLLVWLNDPQHPHELAYAPDGRAVCGRCGIEVDEPEDDIDAETPEGQQAELLASRGE